MRRLAILIVNGILLAGQPGMAAEPGRPITPPEADFVERRVRPILIEQCQNCHGPKKQMSGLRLDSREAMIKGGDNGPALKPGDPEHSALVHAVRHTGMLKMPPKSKLKPEQIATLETWVKMGAPWPAPRKPDDIPLAEAWKRHWAFQPVRNAAPPAVKNTTWAHNSMDRFILAALEEKGLSPSPQADRRTLLRRMTFDLTGLPPTPEEFEDFEQSAIRNPQSAIEKLVDRLLASPHYGERWGRYWLDVARYADTKGYVFFQEADYPWAYTYRDYVIRSFNEDLPFDQFILHQLAADQLPLGVDKRPLTALGFLTAGGRFMNNVHDILDDRIDVVTRGLLGLTATCARCHDHKFDPISSRDYYSLYGVFASSVEPDVPPLFTDPPQTPQYAAFVKELESREKKLADFVRARQNEVLTAARTRSAEYLLAVHAMRDQPAIEEYMLLADGGDINPTMVVRWRAYLNRTGKAHHPVWSLWHSLAALPEKEFAAKARAVITALPAHRDPARPLNERLVLALRNKPPATLNEVAQRYGEVLNAAAKEWQDALQQGADAKKVLPTCLPDPEQEELRRVFLEPDAPPNVNLALINDLQLLPDRASQGKYQELRKAVEQWRATGAGAPARAMVLVDSPDPYEPHVFLRGNPTQLGEAVPRQFLGVLAGTNRQPFKQGSGRLELARAIADRNNPLTARVLVNRVWMHHFGTGLVRTPSDFGLRSEPPSHPQLLDHLAATFMDEGWSLKKLHRRILLSAVYQQQSLDRPECRKVDPENVLLWKSARQRLDFEALRDALLAVSGRLDRTVGGPSVRDSLSPAARRRTLYSFVDRLQVPGLFRTFDFPSPDATAPQRDNTTIPQQALFMLNNPFVLECSRQVLLRPDVVAAREVPGRMERLYRLLYGRSPSSDEVALAREFLTEKPADVAWQRYVQALLVANEFVFVD
jgi:mono/diheme cytochrome c family protein